MHIRHPVMYLVCLLALVSACSRKGDTASEARAVTKPDTTCVLAFAEGTVTGNGKNLSVGDSIPPDAVLETGKDSTAEIVIDGKNAIRMGQSTLLRLDVSTLSRVLTVDRGTLTAVLRKIDAVSGGNLKVRTPNLVAGVRGTSLCAWVAKDGAQTYLCCCNGTIEIAPTDGAPARKKQATHHDAVLYAGVGAESREVPVPAGFDPRHGDSDLESLASRIGETMDWNTLESHD